MPAQNPLSPNRAPPREDHPMMQHAKLAQFAHSLAPDDLASKTNLVGYVTPILGALAGNPKVTSKDVVKATAQAVADGKIQASEAVKFLSTVPAAQEELRPWLKGLYATNMTALVHMKAAGMGAPQQAQQAMPPQAAQGVPQAVPQAAPQQAPMPGVMP